MLKAFADRPQAWVDIRGVLARQRRLDRAAVDQRLAQLVELKEEPPILQRLHHVREEVGRGS